jgi:hypothetical protein
MGIRVYLNATSFNLLVAFEMLPGGADVAVRPSCVILNSIIYLQTK